MAGGGSKSASKAAGSPKARAVVNANPSLQRGRITRAEMSAVGAGNSQVLNGQQMQAIANNRNASQRQRTELPQSRRSEGRNNVAPTNRRLGRNNNENNLLNSLERGNRRLDNLESRARRAASRSGQNNIAKTGNIRDRNNRRRMNRPVTRPGQQETILDRLNRPPGSPAPRSRNQIRRLRRRQA